VVSRFVQLDRHGKSSCPFHNEKSASFSVSAKRNMYKCFGCGESGDGIQFLQKLRNMSFLEAVEAVAEIGSVQVEFDYKINRQALAKAKEERAAIRELTTDAQALFLHYLWKSEEGAGALNYLRQQRGYDNDTLLQWGIGFHPDSYKLLVHRYGADGRIPLAKQAGIIDERDSGPYDVFRGRITFPIHNHQGEIAAFAGRKLPGVEKGPKYLNGTGTGLYDKSRTLYGLYQAISGIGAARFAIIVEGYTDVISMHRAGAANTVATCGTALTAQQCKLLKQHTDRVLLIRDADKAGLDAIERDIPLLAQAGILAHVFQLPPKADGSKTDPDEFAAQYLHQFE
jgi:DNA primase